MRKKWASIHQPVTTLGYLTNNIDETFYSNHCLISGILLKYLCEGGISEAGLTALDMAVRGGRFGNVPDPASRELQEIGSGHKTPIRPSNMKWGRLKFDRLTFLIRLKTPVKIGISLMGGKP